MGRNGIYQLIDEDRITKDREYMDFDGRRKFKEEKDCVQTRTSLAEIDSMTTLFHSERDFRNYLKEEGLDASGRLIYIIYKHEGEQRLACIYNDEVLREFSECTIGAQRGSIDTSKQNVILKLYEMYREITDPKSDFTETVLKRDKPSYMINEHNQELLREFHSCPPDTCDRERFQLHRFFRGFSSYKEFRALYINHREFKKKQELIREREQERNREELKALLKKNRNTPVPGQISMFDK